MSLPSWMSRNRVSVFAREQAEGYRQGDPAKVAAFDAVLCADCAHRRDEHEPFDGRCEQHCPCPEFRKPIGSEVDW